MTLPEILEQYHNKFGLSGLYSKPIEYRQILEDKFKEVEDFITLAFTEGRKEAIEEVLECKPTAPFGQTTYNDALEEWEVEIKSLSQSKENLIKEQSKIEN